MTTDDRMRQRVADLTFIQKWRNEKCHSGGEAFVTVEVLLADLRRAPLIPVAEPPKKARARADIVLAVFMEIAGAPLDVELTQTMSAALAGHIIGRLEEMGVDLS